MFTLQKVNLPQTIEVCGRRYKIHTDFRYWLRFAQHLQQNKKAPPGAFDYMYISDKPASRLAGLVALCEFLNPPSELPRRTSDDDKTIVIDYEIDAPYIFAAFYEQYGIDLLKADLKLHWHKFTALLRGLHDTELNNIIQARLYKPNGRNDEFEKARQKQLEAWRLPQPDETEPDEAREAFLSQLK